MSYDEDEGFEGDFKMNGYEDDDTEFATEEPVEDFGLEEEDPESRYS